MKKTTIFLMLLCSLQAFSQQKYKNVITNENYYYNPREYVSKIDTSKIPTKLLIDRSLYEEIVFEFTGIDKVRTTNYSEWKGLYDVMRNSYYDVKALPETKIIQKTADDTRQESNRFPIAIMNYKFARITQEAINNGSFRITNNSLTDIERSEKSYSTHRLISSSCLYSAIYGDKITFFIPSDLVFTNLFDENIDEIQIDFGNGQGFQIVQMDEDIIVDYSEKSQYELCKVKLTISNKKNRQTTDYYTHFSFLRKGSSSVPLPDKIEENAKKLKTMSNAPLNYSMNFGVVDAYFLLSDATKTEFSNMTNVKLRKPFVVCDGFDPGNKRDYYMNNIQSSDTPRADDFRGLYELINGDRSPWYDSPIPATAGLIDYLRNDGYDIVIVNFIDGAGDIFINAGTSGMRGFLNFLNTNYRDNKTEEIILVGPSMGGIITRLALTSMEQANPQEEHFVKTWISFDSPQQGAYIPLGLQHAVDFLQDTHLFGQQQIFANATTSLNTIAATQMLIYHHTATNGQGNPHSRFSLLYNSLNTLGYPVLSKNYAISNGGKSKLYNADAEKILDFKLFPWTYAYAYGNHNTTGNYYLYEGSRQGFFNDEEIYTSNQIAYENAPGGWNASLYSLNCNPKNNNKKSDTSKPYTKATFMITASTFGIPVTSTNVHNTWEAYMGCSERRGKIKTPFDKVHGMDENEEHVRISVDTRNYLMNDVLHPDFNNIQRPVVRNGNPIHQVVKGKVAYVAKETITFGGNGNTITFEEGSDVTVRTGESIVFGVGTIIKTGAKFSAKIENIDYGTTLKSSSKHTTTPIDYSQKSPYFGKLSNYSIIEKGRETDTDWFNLYPNPTKDRIYFDFIEVPIKIEVCNLDGKIFVVKDNISKAEFIDISHLPSGIYVANVYFAKIVKSFKITKL
ncbi:MAG: T9SS type A sorting domain-containing protein [Bacteroidales bacterium]|jgi:hypothetical protein|nr:T9SS type A sorting domain-containing protein [Bacteroidales bacterium]